MYLLLLLVLLSIKHGLCVPYSRLYPFGPGLDQAFTEADDQHTSLNLTSSFVFYGISHDIVFINNNGLISFYMAVDGYTSERFPVEETLIAPFWADVDTRNGGGSVFYRETNDSAVVNKVDNDVRLAFPDQSVFIAKTVVIVTWDAVGYYRQKKDKVNTFQCVLATDGSRSYVIFLYLDNGINWVTGDLSGGVNGFGGTEAYVGFNSGGSNSTYYAVNGSRTPAVANIETTSNVKVPGLWVFQVNEADIIDAEIESCGKPEIFSNDTTIVNYISTRVNSTATYSCQEGYTLVGIAVRTCLRSGNWSGETPYCLIVNCSMLNIESSSKVLLGLVVSSLSNSYNSTSTYSCTNEGYQLVGTAIRTCQANGNWSGTEPICGVIPQDVSHVFRSSRIKISWNLPNKPSNITDFISHYIVEVTEIRSGEKFQINTDNEMAALYNLKFNTEYSVKVAVFTDYQNPFSDAIEISTQLTAPTQPPFDLKTNELKSTSFTLSWTPPSFSYLNGPNITYIVVIESVHDSSHLSNHTSDGSNTTIFGLQPYTSYSCRVAASNSAGVGPYSTEIIIETAEDVPTSAPNITDYDAADSRTLILWWSPPMDHNSIIRHYEILVTNGQKKNTYISLVRNITIGSLQPSSMYIISVAAFTIGRGPLSDPVTIAMPEDVPSGEPQLLMVVSVTATSLSIAWDPPMEKDKNGIIVLYTVNMTATVTFFTTQFTTKTTNYTLNGLIPDTTYSLIVAASTAIGIGPFTQSLLAKTKESAPSSPQHLSAVTINSTSILLAWDPPIDHNGVITAYYINITDAITGISMQETSDKTHIIVTSLSPNHTYHCLVAAVTNAKGPFSESVSITTDEDAPSTPPLSVTLMSVNSTSISISWSSPNTANGIIRHYRVSITNAATGMEEAINSVTTHIQIAMLTPFNTYSIKVAAFTVGIGPYSEPINVTTLQDVPGSPPENFTATANGPTVLHLQWSPPNSKFVNGNITHYLLTVTQQTSSNTPLHYNTTELELIINDLMPYMSYTCTVSAVTIATGPAATLVVKMPESIPSGPPINVSVREVSYTSINVSWFSPIRPNGLIRLYIIRVSNGSFVNYTATGTSMHITELMPYQQYSVSVSAVTIDSGPFSPTQIITLQEGVATAPPAGLSSDLKGNTLYLSWQSPPTNSVNGIIDGYQVNCSGLNNHFVSVTVPDTRASIDLENGTDYICIVCTLTSAGCGPSAVSYISTHGDSPVGPPVSLSVITTDTKIFIEWESPSDPFNIIESYTITYQLVSTPLSLTVPRPAVTVSGIIDTQYSLESILSSSSYHISVYAIANNGKAGVESNPVTALTKEPGSNAPQNFTCFAVSSTAIDCLWGNATDEDEDYELYYSILPSFIYYGNAEGTIDIDFIEDRVHLDNLIPYSGYFISLQNAESNITLANTVALTQAGRPSASVEGVSFNVVSPVSVSISWRPPAKSEWNGVIKNFAIIASPIRSIGDNQSLTNPVSKRSVRSPRALDDIEITAVPQANNPDPSLAVEPFKREEVTISNLEQDFEYSLTVSIVNDAGRGTQSSPIYMSMPEAAPSGPPLNLTLVNANQTSFNVMWFPPALIERNGKIVSYMVQVTRVKINQTRSFEHQLNNLFLQGYHPFEPIIVRVAARTSVGLGPYSSPLAFNTSQNVPSAPVSFRGDVISSNTIILSWGIPETVEGVITQYQVIYSGYRLNTTKQIVGPVQENVTGTSLQVSSLKPILVYHFLVRAKTAAGYGGNATTIIVLKDISTTVSNFSDSDDTSLIVVSIFLALLAILLCFLLCLILICLLARHRRKKRKNESPSDDEIINPEESNGSTGKAQYTNLKDNSDEYEAPDLSKKPVMTVSTTVPETNKYEAIASPVKTPTGVLPLQVESKEFSLHFADESSEDESENEKEDKL